MAERVPCPSCDRELELGDSECPHCGAMASLRVALYPGGMAAKLGAAIAIIVVGLFLKFVLFG